MSKNTLKSITISVDTNNNNFCLLCDYLDVDFLSCSLFDDSIDVDENNNFIRLECCKEKFEE